MVVDASTSRALVAAAAKALVAFLNEGLLETLLLGEGDDGVLALADNEDVIFTGGEVASLGILDVSKVVGTGVGLNVLEDTDTANIVTTGNEDGSTVFEFDDTLNCVSLKV